MGHEFSWLETTTKSLNLIYKGWPSAILCAVPAKSKKSLLRFSWRLAVCYVRAAMARGTGLRRGGLGRALQPHRSATDYCGCWYL
jgi:hypothetical protein